MAMRITGVHGTSLRNGNAIRASGTLFSGSASLHFLSHGPYGYHACPYSPRGFAVACGAANSFSLRKYPYEQRVRFAITALVDHVLDVQHPDILAVTHEIAPILIARAGELGLLIEPNRGTYDRSESHFVLGMFFELYEANYGRRLDAVRALFPGHFRSPLEEAVSHEICFRNAGKIVDIRLIETPEDLDFVERVDPWILDNQQRRAARGTVPLARSMSDADFIDAAMRVASGPSDNRRFGYPRRVSLVAGGNRELLGEVQRHWRPTPTGEQAPVLFSECLAGLGGVERVRFLEELLDKSNGIVAVADAFDSDSHSALLSFLVRARTRGLPMLVFTVNANCLPPEVLSARNVIIIVINPKARRLRSKQIDAALEGFLNGNFNESTLQCRLHLMNVARGRCENNEHRTKKAAKKARDDETENFKEIVVAARNNYRLSQELLFAEREDILRDLPLENPEQIGEQLRERMGIKSYGVTMTQILQAMNARDLPVSISNAGYTIPAGYFGPCAVVALKKDDGAQRQKFTAAHELGHLIVGKAKYELRLNELAFPNEEALCDRIGAAFLMPGSEIDRYAEEIVALEQWLKLPDDFGVSVAAGAERLWERRGLLFVPLGSRALRDPVRRDLAEKVLAQGRGLNPDGERRGDLMEDVRYYIRRTKHGIQGIADFSKVLDRF